MAGEALAGRCTDIGVKGMRLDLPEIIAPGSQGVVNLCYHNLAIELKARVARTGTLHCGLEFVYDSPAEQGAVVHLLAKLTAPHNRGVMSLVPRVDASLGGPLPQH